MKILGYHKIENRKKFENEILALMKKDKIIPLQKSFNFPKKGIVLTFDDGTRDHLEIVAPILEKYDLPTIFFVSIGKCGKKGYLTKKEIKKLSDKGFEIGNHTLNHKILTRLFYDEIFKEISTNKKELENLLGKEITSFCCPGGAYNRKVIKAVKKTGHSCCIVGQNFFKNKKDPYYLVRGPNKFSRFVKDLGRSLTKDNYFKLKKLLKRDYEKRT